MESPAANDVNNCDSPASKKRKLEDNKQISIHESLNNLTEFKLEKILYNNTNRKSICLQGVFHNSKEPALVLLEKTGFTETNFNGDSEFFTEKSSLKQIFHNDIYGNYEFLPKLELNSIGATIIHPATEKHIKKYSIQNVYLVDETPALYEEVTLPHITEEQFDLQWVYNILDHKSEADRIVFEDPDDTDGFILIPDLKWDGKLESLYLLGLVRVHGLKSLRDLTAAHLPLLRNLKESGTKAICEKYGLTAAQLRIYLHYQPSFYHLHVHFTNLNHDAPGTKTEKSHLLSNVISNIELVPDYYQRATLPFIVREGENLVAKFEKKGVLTRGACRSSSP
ncbi:hypothetical protein PPYR_14426 [Photinus pyralis]|uniref:m7GpppX diphosphatase n=2 Tax=Photinus pyralis TaxID=7054 RepID=A0A5N4A585_PHOPY|nr:m7GpppX diphosphatase [Photinus pyralis]KAB0792467.1 hypothetical protein PPYR_14426 [Photinus pyralis]